MGRHSLEVCGSVKIRLYFPMLHWGFKLKQMLDIEFEITIVEFKASLNHWRSCYTTSYRLRLRSHDCIYVGLKRDAYELFKAFAVKVMIVRILIQFLIRNYADTLHAIPHFIKKFQELNLTDFTSCTVALLRAR